MALNSWLKMKRLYHTFWIESLREIVTLAHDDNFHETFDHLLDSSDYGQKFIYNSDILDYEVQPVILRSQWSRQLERVWKTL